MANSFQLESIQGCIKTYVFAIIFSSKRKNFTAMSKEINIPKKQLCEIYKNSEDNSKKIKSLLMKMVEKQYKKTNPSVLILDPTVIRKWFAKDIENIAYDYDGIINKSKRCLVPVVSAWTNLKITIPLDFKFWVNKQFVKNYRKKTDIAQELILEQYRQLKIDYVTLDGAFASEGMINFFIKNDINFCMRMAKNRVIISQNGTKAQLQKHPELKFKKNERYKTIKAFYKGLSCYFTAHKRYNKNGKSYQIVFIVSSLNILPKEQADAYKIRWNIEKTFRTMKQSLGLGDCQCVSFEKQKLHILSVFLAYAKLEEQKICNRKKSPEEVLKKVRQKKTPKCSKTRPMKLKK